MAKKSRKKVKSKSKVSSVSVKSSVYVDNKLNRRLGRVGKKYVKGKSNKYTVSKGVSVKSKVGKSKKPKKGVSKPKKSRPIEVGRYQKIISAISKWNKKQFKETGYKFTRKEMYERYRMIRDDFSTVSTKDIVLDIGLYLQGRRQRTLEEFLRLKPDIASKPIEWWDFDSELEVNFKKKSKIFML